MNTGPIRISSRPVPIRCNIHPWMTAYAWILDYPYAAVTDRDGNCEIRNVPAGVNLRVAGWHETAGWLTEGGGKGEPIRVEPGQVTDRIFRVKAKPQ